MREEETLPNFFLASAHNQHLMMMITLKIVTIVRILMRLMKIEDDGDNMWTLGFGNEGFRTRAVKSKSFLLKCSFMSYNF